MIRSYRKTAAAAAALTVAGLVLAGGETTRARSADVTLVYDCGFPSGNAETKVGVGSVFPGTGTAGTGIRPEKATVALTVPHGSLGPGTVSGTGRLGIEMTQAGAPVRFEWPGLAVPETPVDEDADTVLVGSGPVPATPPPSAGDVTFAAGALTLDLDSGAAIACSPKPGQETTLATVHVAAAPQATATPSPSPSPTPYGCFPPPAEGRRQACAFFTGYANVAKLDAALALNDERFEEPVPIGVLFSFGGEQGADVEAEFRFVRPLRSRATFLAFGFTPVTATIELRQEGTGSLRSTGMDVQTVSGGLRVSVRLSDVVVNGVPMDVGDRCRTAPTTITLADVPGQPIHDILGELRKALQGRSFTIPRFTGCAAGGEDLDRLFNGAVAGPGNYMKITLGRLVYKDVKPPLPEPYR